jgi:uncharacterized protein (DUF1330 family)
MAAEAPRHVVWKGLEVSDERLYARYRERMTPILEAYRGCFEHDFVVARVLRSSGSHRVNRVFALSFPDRAAHDGFFADERYRRIRAELFEPAVARHESYEPLR